MRGWQDMTAADVDKLQKGRRTAQDGVGVQIAKPSKYRNVKVVIDGQRFDSKREAAIYQELKLREKAGEVRGLRCQVKFPLYAPDLTIRRHSGRTVDVQVAEYVADFVFEELGLPTSENDHWFRVVADCKGGRNTAMFNLKRKWLELQSGIQIREMR